MSLKIYPQLKHTTVYQMEFTFLNLSGTNAPQIWMRLLKSVQYRGWSHVQFVVQSASQHSREMSYSIRHVRKKATESEEKIVMLSKLEISLKSDSFLCAASISSVIDCVLSKTGRIYIHFIFQLYNPTKRL